MFLISTRGPNTLTAASHGQKEQRRQESQIYVQKWVLRKKQKVFPVQLFPNFLVCDPLKSTNVYLQPLLTSYDLSVDMSCEQFD